LAAFRLYWFVCSYRKDGAFLSIADGCIGAELVLSKLTGCLTSVAVSFSLPSQNPFCAESDG
jgi:hypothetical protein